MSNANIEKPAAGNKTDDFSLRLRLTEKGEYG